MNKHEIREFANRDWERLSALDRIYWAKEYKRNGSAVIQKASQALWQHMKSIRPEWPDAQERRRDLDNHIALKKLLDQAADGLSPR
ncbi:MAG: hypothetical protein A2W28_06665 [Gammaproteobacteria bacterium RBG_16_51_14]|nr:MAG: hypothetical protein A2W28_06665 [Gammaproteobacteria bacterium RBG_16_51_14]